METAYIVKALEDGHLRVDKSGRTERLVYVAVNRGERWSDPEEKVRAEFYAELIYRYGYSPDRIAASYFRVRLWTQKELLEQLFAHYEHLDADLRAELPLKRIWTVAAQDED